LICRNAAHKNSNRTRIKSRYNINTVNGAAVKIPDRCRYLFRTVSFNVFRVRVRMIDDERQKEKLFYPSRGLLDFLIAVEQP